MMPDKSPRNLPTRSLALLAIWLLVMALVLSQTLGLVHAVVHSPVHGSGGAAASGLLDKSQGKVGKALQAPDKGWIASLFPSHTSSSDCRIYDQAGHGSAALHVVSLALLVVLPSIAVAIFQGQALARWAALFDARGPPLTR